MKFDRHRRLRSSHTMRDLVRDTREKRGFNLSYFRSRTR